MIFIASVIFVDSRNPMGPRHHEVAEMFTTLESQLSETEVTSIAERTTASILDSFTDAQAHLTDRQGCGTIVICVTNGERDASLQMLIEQRLTLLPRHTLFIFATMGTDASTEAWFEHLINDHPYHGKTFAVMRDYINEGVDDEFVRCLNLLNRR